MSVEGERELEEFLAGALSGQAEEPEPEPAEEEEEVVIDERPGRDLPPEAPKPAPEPVEASAEEEGDEEETEADQHTAWATKKYGKDPAQWAKAAFAQEQFISRLADEKRQAEEYAQQAMEYAQQAELQAQSQFQSSMPLSASEEAWVEQSAANPGQAAYQAARAGNANLFNAVLEQVAMENPGMAAQIGTQVNLALQQEAAQYQAQVQANGQQQAPDFNAELGQSLQRVGVDIQKYGPAMSDKLGELGEYHQYTLAILGGDQIQRDLAVRAVYDLVRQGDTTTRRVVDTEREARIAREGELRRDAASVVTGSPHVPPPEQHPFMAEMENEWRRRGQWTDDE